jgi:hypothetical protein
MRMIERRHGADAHEFPSANLDDRNAQIVVEMRDYRIRHMLDFQFVSSMRENNPGLRAP